MDENDKSLPGLYSYEPLDTTKQQIRLLKLAQNSSGPISCTVNTFDLNDAPPYSALSYTWGHPMEVFEIFLNGQTFQVRNNLFRFLETFRREREHTYLWIDQICIAQANVKERNHQVNIMSKIYSQCTSTIVWLCDNEGLYPDLAADFNATRTGASLARLVADAYFTRLWVVQEVLLSPHVRVLVSGNVWVSWAAMRDCFQTKGWKPTPAKALVLHTFGQSSGVPDLIWYIRRFSSNKCEDARDKVYGLQGLVHQTKRVEVDYNKRPFDVWVDVVLACPTDRHFEVLWHLGEDMGIETADIVSLDSFLALLLPTINVGGAIDNVKLVSSIDETLKREKPMISGSRRAQSAKRKRPPEDPDLEQRFWYPDLRTDDAFFNPRKSHPARNKCHRFRFNSKKITKPFFPKPWDIVKDVIDGKGLEPHVEASEKQMARFQQRVAARTRPPDTIPGFFMQWCFYHEGKAYKYPCAPNWEAIFRLDPMFMKMIVERLQKSH